MNSFIDATFEQLRGTYLGQRSCVDEESIKPHYATKFAASAQRVLGLGMFIKPETSVSVDAVDGHSAYPTQFD
jgi:hypothetical protein